MPAQNIGQPYEVSNSEIQTYKDCRRKWYLSYYRRLTQKTEKHTGPLALGSRVHEALDRYYTNNSDLVQEYNQLLAEDQVKAAASGEFMDEFYSEGDLGRIMLEGYLQWSAEEGIDADLDMISTEEIINMPLMNNEVLLKGKIDMRVRRKSDGVRMFRDFKTVGTSFNQFMATAGIDEQILTYMLLEQHQNSLMGEDERSEGGIFTLLRKVKRGASAKPPFYAQYEVNHNIFTLRSFWQRIHGVLGDLMNTKKSLDAGADHRFVAYPRPSKDCSWKCPFFQICPLFDDGSAAEDAISELYTQHDPYDYYGPSIDKKGTE